MPYVVSVPLGVMPQGNYHVVINEGKKSEKSKALLVDAAGSESIDNYTYANVTNITRSTDRLSLHIEGEHPSSCMDMERVELVPNDAGDTITVLPIVKQISSPCDCMVKPFVIDIPVPDNSQPVVYHVRRIDGRAVNYKW